MDANGDVSVGTIINLENVNFGGLDLNNVRASVMRNQKAPLLLGQNVLGRLGRIEIDNSKNILIVTHNKLYLGILYSLLLTYVTFRTFDSAKVGGIIHTAKK